MAVSSLSNFLVVQDENGINGIKPWDPLNLDTWPNPATISKGMAQSIDYLQDIIRYGNQMGFGIYQSDHEDANGQYEINFDWSDAVKACDRLVLFRLMSGQIAQKYGAIATFLAKPFEDKTRVGAHLHFHVADAESGKNLFPLKDGQADWKGLGLSKTAIHYIGGLLKHCRAITAVSSPQINCYGASRAVSLFIHPIPATHGHRRLHPMETTTGHSFTAAPAPTV